MAKQFVYRGKTIRYELSEMGVPNSDTPAKPQRIRFYDPVDKQHDELDIYPSELDDLPRVYGIVRERGAAGRTVTTWRDEPEPPKAKPEPPKPKPAPPKLPPAPAEGPRAGDPDPELHIGDSGEPVKELQQLLNAWGGLDAILFVNGQFDAATESAVKAFQAGKSLPEPSHSKGYVDKATWRELRRFAGPGAPGAGGRQPGAFGPTAALTDDSSYYHALPFGSPFDGIWLPWADAPAEPVFISDPAYVQYLSSLNYAAAFEIHWRTVATDNLVIAYIFAVMSDAPDADFFLEMVEETLGTARHESRLEDLQNLSPELLEMLELASRPSLRNFGRQPDKDFRDRLRYVMEPPDHKPNQYELHASTPGYRAHSTTLSESWNSAHPGRAIPDPRLVLLFRSTSGNVGAMEGIIGTLSVIMGDDPETTLRKMDVAQQWDGMASAVAGMPGGIPQSRPTSRPTRPASPSSSRSLEMQGLRNTAFVPRASARPLPSFRRPGPTRGLDWRRPAQPVTLMGKSTVESWLGEQELAANDNPYGPNLYRMPQPKPVAEPKPMELPQEWKQASSGDTTGRAVASGRSGRGSSGPTEDRPPGRGSSGPTEDRPPRRGESTRGPAGPPPPKKTANGRGETVYPEGATLKNSKGQDVKIPPGHTMSLRDPPMDAPPIIRKGGSTSPNGFTDAERAGFLAGNDGGTMVTPHHRHQIAIRDGGVMDELPRFGHPEGNEHLGGSPTRHPNDGKAGRNGTVFDGPAGDKLHSDEVKQYFKDKGNRLVKDPSTGLWVDPLAK